MDVTLPASESHPNGENKNFYALDAFFCQPCYDRLAQDMSLCGSLSDGSHCSSFAMTKFSTCLQTATNTSNSGLYNATLLAISVTRHNGQPVPESTSLTIAEEGDYFINVTNGDQVNKETMASSATVDLNPVGRIFYPDEIKWKDPFLVKSVHLTPGEYTLTVEVRSNPGAYLTIVVSDVDFGSLPLEGE
jgi:hypothetical protein